MGGRQAWRARYDEGGGVREVSGSLDARRAFFLVSLRLIDEQVGETQQRPAQSYPTGHQPRFHPAAMPGAMPPCRQVARFLVPDLEYGQPQQPGHSKHGLAWHGTAWSWQVKPSLNNAGDALLRQGARVVVGGELASPGGLSSPTAAGRSIAHCPMQPRRPANRIPDRIADLHV